MYQFIGFLVPFLISISLFFLAILIFPSNENQETKEVKGSFLFTPLLGAAIFFALIGLYKVGVVLIII